MRIHHWTLFFYFRATLGWTVSAACPVVSSPAIMAVSVSWHRVAPAAHAHKAMRVRSARNVLMKAAFPNHVAMAACAEKRLPSSAASACQAGGVNDASRNPEWSCRCPSAHCLTAMARPTMACVTRCAIHLLATGMVGTARWLWTRGHAAPTRTAGASSTTASVTKHATLPNVCMITLTAGPRRKSASKSLDYFICILYQLFLKWGLWTPSQL